MADESVQSPSNATPTPAAGSGDDVLSLLTGLESRLDELKKFHAEKTLAEARLRDQAEKLDARKRELESLGGALEARSAELDEARTELARAQESLALARGEVEAGRQAVEEARAALEAERAEFGDARARAEEAQRRAEELEGRVDEARARAEEFERAAAGASDRADGLQSRVEELEAEVAQLRVQHEQIRSGVAQRIEQLVSELAEAEQSRDAERAAREQQEGLAGERARELSAVHEAAQRRDEELASLRAALDEALGRAARAEEDAIAALGEVESERDKALASARRDAVRADELEAQLTDLNERLGELARLASEREQRIAALEGELASAREASNQGQGELESQARAAREYAGALERRVEELEAELASAGAAVGVAAEELDALRERAGRLDEAEAALAERQRELEALRATLAELEAQRDAGDGEAAAGAARVAELEAALAEARDRLELAEQGPAGSGEVEKLRARVAELDGQVREAGEDRDAARARVAQLERAVGELASRLEHGQGALSRDATFIKRRRERLAIQRRLLAAQSQKLRKASVALRQKFDESERLLAKRAEVHSAARAVAEAQKTAKRQRATIHAVWTLTGIVATLAILAGLSIGVVKQVVPGRYLASSVVAPDGQGREVGEGDIAAWGAFMTDLFSDPRFHEDLSSRMRRRGIAELGEAAVVAQRLSSDLAVTETPEGHVRVELVGEGAERTERELETIVAAAASVANGARQNRPDGLLTVVTSPAQAGDDPVDASQLLHALAIFGAGAAVCLIVGVVVWRRMAGAKSAFEREVLAAASDDFVHAA